jgi:deazaflavin-dependent oxidoreductase (nitroreductase family)
MNPISEQIVDNPDDWVSEHIREYVATEGRKGHRLPGWKASTLLLVTRGRRSGVLRRTALAYAEHDGRYVVVASNGGAPRHPAWYLNLEAAKRAEIQIGAHRSRVRVEIVDPASPLYAELWQKGLALYPNYAAYKARTARVIPIVELLPEA